MEGPFPAPQRMHPPAPPLPSWERAPAQVKGSKRVSLFTQSSAGPSLIGAPVSAAVGGTPAAAVLGIAETHDDPMRASGGVLDNSASDAQSHTARRHAAPRWSTAPRGVTPEAIPEALLHDERLQTSESYYYTSGPDVNSVFFQHAFLEDLAEREVAYKLRRSIYKVASRFAEVRLEGLRESLQQLTAFATEAAVEAAIKARPDDSSAASAPIGAAALHPYDSVRAELLPHMGASAVSRATSVVGHSTSWDRVQRALRCGDLTMPLSTYVLAMRTDTRGMMNRGLPVRVEVSEEEALAWGQNGSSLPARAAQAPTAAGASPASTLLVDTLISVSWLERQLALRVMQGLSLTVYYQRRCLSDGFLFHYATEQMQCFLQHVEARHRLVHRKAMQSDGWSGESHTGSHSGNTRSAPPATSAGGHGNSSSSGNNTRVVDIDSDVLAALIALVEAVEAACHYCSAGLSRLVQAGGVVALMNVVYCPYAPLDLRASILDAISVLLQEVAPFRRMVVSSAPPQSMGHAAGGGDGAAAAGPAPVEQDDALAVMLHGAFHGYSEAPVNRAGGGVNGHMANLRKPVTVGPPPYGLDRASASKFDSSVREWLSQHGLSHVVSGVLGLRDVSESAIGDSADPVERTRSQRATQRREKRIQDLLLVIDGRRAELD